MFLKLNRACWALALALLGATNVNAQGHIPGEFIVMFHAQQDAQKFASAHGLEWAQALSPRAHIHLLRAQGETTSAQDWAVLRALQNDPLLEAAQFNHEVQNRETEPNDPQLPQQWHHVQSGDHDIDSDLAWDITTGGAAADGSRIVVAVLEGGGSNYNHVDLIDNHWVNTAEIPDNGIDDDGNGFVDDYNGWNSGSNNDNIAGGGHGTSVSGMIGATGDNGLGGVGVNWDVDIMQVDMGNGLTDANVIAAYNYPFVMRSIFNESGGALGAFVVATNASWGIDLANPANHPVWCAYYDDLGAQGILNCGATANSPFNIDTQYDMPTGCSSPYMVSVTATNDNDVRTSSAYGATTIDLGAPGVQVYLPSGSSGYSSTTGTSFASPCVAGAIALVYSVPCPDLMELALSNPQGAADLVRDYILDGTDEVPNLIGETVTGGRLNVFNSLNLAMDNCGPLECAPDAISASTSCVYDEGSAQVMTQIELGVELSSFLCSTSTVCMTNTSDSSAAMCVPLAINSGDTYLFDAVEPNAVYELYYTMDSLASEVVVVETPACDALVPGCTGPTAYNYNPEATIDDGSCDFPCVDVELTILTDCYPDEVGWEIVSGDTVVASLAPGTYTDVESEYVFEQCLTVGCYTFVLTDEYGDGLNGSFWNQCDVDGAYMATDSSGTVLFQMGDPDFGDQVEHNFCLPAIFGCTNEEACNYDAEANTDNGTCEVPGGPCDDGDESTVFDMLVFDVLVEGCMCEGVLAVPGCMDDDACNYNMEANVDDESCVFMGEGAISGPLFPDAGDVSTYTYSGAEGTTFTWTVVGGEVMAGQGTNSIEVTWGADAGPGSVTVLEGDGMGCEGEVVRTVTILATSNLDEAASGAISLSPNPAREAFVVTFDQTLAGQVEVVLFDALGAQVKEVQTQGEVSVQDLAPGRYTAQVRTPRGVQNLPVVVE